MRTEDTLRDAFLLLDEHAPRTLERHATTTTTGRRPSHRRFLAPALAAAAVTAVAVGTLAAVGLSRSHVSSRPTGSPSVVAHPTWTCPSGDPPQSRYLVSLDARGRDHLEKISESCPGADLIQSQGGTPQLTNITATVTVWARGAYTPPTFSAEKAVEIDGRIGHIQSRPNGPLDRKDQGVSIALGQTTLYWQYAPGAYVEVTSTGQVSPPTSSNPYPVAEPATAAQLIAIARGTSWRGQSATVPVSLSAAPAGLSLVEVVDDDPHRFGVALAFCSGGCEPFVPNVSIGITAAHGGYFADWAGKKSITVKGHRAAYEPPLFDTPARLEMVIGPWDIVVAGQARAQPGGTGMGYHPEVSYTQAELTVMAASVTKVATTDKSTWLDVSAAIPGP